MNLIREQLNEHISVRVVGEEEFEAELELPPDFAGFKGHFPGNPVLPGVCVVAAVLVCVESIFETDLKMTCLKTAKFFAPVEPEDEIRIRGSIEREAEILRVRATLTCGRERKAKVSLVAELRQSQKGG